MIKTVIIEDEPYSREYLETLVGDYCKNVELVGRAGDVTSGFDSIKKLKPDLVLLDIEMPDGTGFELLQKFQKVNFEVIFTTAFAEYAVQAALTGHLVMSTLHTNDTSSTITRLLDLGVYPFLVASTLLGVVAQRLVRRICPYCKVEDVLTEEQVLTLGIKGAHGRHLKVHRGTGCVKCRGTGYLGRTGIFEVMPITPRLARLITEKAPAAEFKKEALNDGMLTLRDYAIKKMAQGETTYEEVISVTDDVVVY